MADQGFLVDFPANEPIDYHLPIANLLPAWEKSMREETREEHESC